MPKLTPQQRLANVERAIAERREKRAQLLAWTAWAFLNGITAEMMQGATDHEWAQLAHAAHVAERPAGRIHDRHYVPSIETRRLTLRYLAELEKGRIAA